MKIRLTYGERLGIVTISKGDKIPVSALLRAGLCLPKSLKDHLLTVDTINRAVSSLRKWGAMLQAGEPEPRDHSLNLRISQSEQDQIEGAVELYGTGTYANLLRKSFNFRPLLSTRQEAALVSRKRKKLCALDRKGLEEVRRVQGLEQEAKTKEIGVPHVR